MENRTKIILDEKDLPKKWYNIRSDLARTSATGETVRSRYVDCR